MDSAGAYSTRTAVSAPKQSPIEAANAAPPASVAVARSAPVMLFSIPVTRAMIREKSAATNNHKNLVPDGFEDGGVLNATGSFLENGDRGRAVRYVGFTHGHSAVQQVLGQRDA